MKILLSNDDGYLAPGIRALLKVLNEVAEVIMVAPDRNRSGVSNSLTLDRPLRVTTHSDGGHSVNGTPTDCVHLAITGLLDEMPDIVISGINEGSNLSDDVLYSGTVAAATEGRFLGLPAIAVSLSGHHAQHYDTAAQITKQIVERLQKHPLPIDTILNVNVPDLPMSEIKGIQVTRLGTRHSAQEMIESEDPRKNKVFWVGLPGNAQDAGPGTDFYAVERGYISITPLQLDLTHYRAFEHLSTWVEAFEKEHSDQQHG
ncbi:MAG: 5'/3'-nucleotidase SurE [Gammaproteobacteria bacterium]